MRYQRLIQLEALPARPQPALDSEPFNQYIFDDGSVWTEFHRDGDNYLLRFPGLADFLVSADGRKVRVHAVETTDESTIEHLYINQLVPLALSRQGIPTFHASVVTVPGGAVAFLGKTGAGKSTLAASFALQGSAFLTDDGLIEMISKDAQAKANIRVLALSVGGMRNIMNSKRPITSPDDLKGMRMRVAKNPILLDTYASLGSDAIGIASAETYGALQTKMVDGHDGGSGWAYAQKLFEVQNYYSLTGHQMVVTSVIINNDFFESLPPEIQDALERAAKDAAVKNMEWMRSYEKDIYKHFEDAGLEINTLDLAPFREAVRPVWDEYAEHVGGWDRIKKVQDLQKQCK